MSKNNAYSLPNILTYARIIAVPLVVVCFFLEGRLQSSDAARWGALAIFAIASITDFLDGYLARIWKQTSTIGRMLDPIADKLLVSACLLLLAADGTIAGWSLWAAIIILCREILVSGLREYLAELKVSVPVTPACQMEDHYSDGCHRISAGGTCRRRNRPGDHHIGYYSIVDRRIDNAVHWLGLFPGRAETRGGLEPFPAIVAYSDGDML